MDEYFNPDIKILMIKRQPLGRYWNMADLAAPYWRFYWNSSEGASVWFGKKEYPLTPSVLTLIPPDTHFSSTCSGMPIHYYMHFTAGPPFTEIQPQIIRMVPGGEMLSRIRGAVKMFSSKKADPIRLSLEALQIILACLCAVPEKSINRREIDPRVAAAMKMIDENPASPPSNAVIAGRLAMSTNSFLRLFRRNAGISPQLYSRNKRIDKACILLHYSGFDIKQIAAETGFCDRFHFSRVFRALRGVGPAEFRKIKS